MRGPIIEGPHMVSLPLLVARRCEAARTTSVGWGQGTTKGSPFPCGACERNAWLSQVETPQSGWCAAGRFHVAAPTYTTIDGW